MKLASLKGGRDGRLVVVSDDLAYFAYAGHVATTLQDVLDNWDMLAPKLELLATDLAHAVIPRERFHERDAASPLPRAFQRVGGPAWFVGPRDAIGEGRVQAGVAVVTDDVPMGISADEARGRIRLVGLVNDIRLNGPEGARVSAFSPVFITPDSLGAAWGSGKLLGTLNVDVNGTSAGRAVLNEDFGPLIANAAKSGPLGAGTIISCAATESGPSLNAGDSVRVWMDDEKHHPIFGVIEQAVG
jgi:fumarylacetoacetate (FAA) hydrolase